MGRNEVDYTHTGTCARDHACPITIIYTRAYNPPRTSPPVPSPRVKSPPWIMKSCFFPTPSGCVCVCVRKNRACALCTWRIAFSQTNQCKAWGGSPTYTLMQRWKAEPLKESSAPEVGDWPFSPVHSARKFCPPSLWFDVHTCMS